MHVLNCLIKDVHVCIDVANVNKILPLLLLEAVPNSPNYVAGLFNLEGKVIPVIDLAMRLGMERVDTYTLDMSVLLCNYGEYQAGFIIDKVLSLSEVNQDDIQMHEKFDTKDSSFVGTATLKNSISLLVNIEHLLPINMHHEMGGCHEKHGK